MLTGIKEAINRIDALGNSKPLKVIGHFDTDGITSSAIFSRAMNRWGKKFSLEIVKGLEESFIDSLGEESVLIFLDLASGSLEQLSKKKTEVFIFDHHELTCEVPKNVFMVNPHLTNEENVCTATICYLFAEELSSQNKDLANLAVLGMVGDQHEKNKGKIFERILGLAETVVKKGLLVYPSTRPLCRTLEYSSNPYLPGVSGNRDGVFEVLRDSGISLDRSLYELSEEEMTRLITTLVLKSKGVANQENLIGNIYLTKFFNKQEDARELSALVNACSRMGRSDIALAFCLGNKSARKDAEKIYIEYKQSLMSALKYVSESEKLEGKDYMIINARDNVKDTIIGTVASMISHSPLYDEGLVIVALAYNGEKIKVSARLSGRTGRNVREVLARAIVPIGGEVGGHPNAAGCLISKEHEGVFINELKRILEVEVVRV